jgi:hypothetical protein
MELGGTWTLAIEPWRVGTAVPVLADFHQFDDEQDPDLHNSERSDPDRRQSKKK